MTATTPAPRQPVMSDVARMAGVSHQTVSRVLNDTGPVREETRRRVLEAIDALGYRRNPAARALVTQRSGLLGVITPFGIHHGPVHTLLGVEEAARARGMSVVLCSLAEVRSGTMSAAMRHLAGQNVEGIVVVTSVTSVVGSLPVPEGLPVVVAQARPGGHLPSVSVDHELGARLATRHLLEAGHRTVLHVRGPHDWPEGDRRVRGWEEALAEVGAPVEEPLLGDWSGDSGYQAGQEVVRRWRELPAGERPTAVFAANDLMAFGLMHALHEAGLRVPADVAVVGFDDVPGAAHSWPPLTTLRQDFRELGRQCVHALLARLDGGQQIEPVDAIPPQLVVRCSSGAP
ncbi:LacI family DNA-binding transcriptional regulator [Kineococcus xinjiangensis]|uniref:LacI family DNA-binding transcriptional regulator n=1 Tax=Kineococcus xinjiangensis TaxID=512762 RepID=UPI001B801931|nr:LacI family DNA-binding transcriptional regulator [Kineococcus xinjiangensis]